MWAIFQPWRIKMDVLQGLTEVFRMVFEDDSIELTRAMTADDYDGWDSMSHVTLLMAVEDHFGVTFEDWEVMNLPDVGALADLVQKKL
ncbi:MAG: acyl carrier protein [Anaerolineae bacterium]|nr:acyl carrier protein [Anaerolineae bacterium]